MTTVDRHWRNQIDAEFLQLVPGIDEAFKKIWTFETIPEFRSHWTTTRAQFADFVPLDGFQTEHQTIALPNGISLGIRLYRPTKAKKGEPLPLLFVLHGGGWVVGNHDSENSMCRCICVRNSMAVISVEYRRAPEHQFPTAVEDGFEAYQWIQAHAEQLCIDKSRVVLAGTSAGANLVASLAIKLRDESAADGLIGQLLNIPAVCHPDYFPTDRFSFTSYEDNEDAPTINGQSMRWFWKQYCPSLGSHPLASPLLASNHTSLPPALIQVAGLDALRDDGMAYSQILEEAGVHVTLKLYPGLPHGFVLAVHMEIVNTYYRSMVQWVESRLQSFPAP